MNNEGDRLLKMVMHKKLFYIIITTVTVLVASPSSAKTDPDDPPHKPIEEPKMFEPFERWEKQSEQEDYYYQIKTTHLKEWNTKTEKFLSFQNVNYKKIFAEKTELSKYFLKNNDHATFEKVYEPYLALYEITDVKQQGTQDQIYTIMFDHPDFANFFKKIKKENWSLVLDPMQGNKLFSGCVERENSRIRFNSKSLSWVIFYHEFSHFEWAIALKKLRIIVEKANNKVVGNNFTAQEIMKNFWSFSFGSTDLTAEQEALEQLKIDEPILDDIATAMQETSMDLDDKYGSVYEENTELNEYVAYTKEFALAQKHNDQSLMMWDRSKALRYLIENLENKETPTAKQLDNLKKAKEEYHQVSDFLKQHKTEQPYQGIKSEFNFITNESFYNKHTLEKNNLGRNFDVASWENLEYWNDFIELRFRQESTSYKKILSSEKTAMGKYFLEHNELGKYNKFKNNLVLFEIISTNEDVKDNLSAEFIINKNMNNYLIEIKNNGWKLVVDPTLTENNYCDTEDKMIVMAEYAETKDFLGVYSEYKKHVNNVSNNIEIDKSIRDAATIINGSRDLTKNTAKTYEAIKSFATSDLLDSPEATDLNKADLFVIRLTVETCQYILTGIAPFEFDPKNFAELQRAKDNLDKALVDVDLLLLKKGIDTGTQSKLAYSEEIFKEAGTINSDLFKAVFGDISQVKELFARIERTRP